MAVAAGWQKERRCQAEGDWESGRLVQARKARSRRAAAGSRIPGDAEDGARAGQSAADLLRLGAEDSRGRYMIGPVERKPGSLQVTHHFTLASEPGTLLEDPIRMCEFDSTSNYPCRVSILHPLFFCRPRDFLRSGRQGTGRGGLSEGSPHALPECCHTKGCRL